MISVALLASGCSERFAFEEIDSSLIGRESPIPIHTLEEAKDEIKEFTGKLKNKAQQQLNTPFVTEGLLALADKNYVKANTNFQRALKYEPRNSFLHVLNALSHQMRGETGDPEQFEMADVGYTLAARMDPGYSQVPYLQGILKFRQQDYAEAQEHFARAAMLEPERPEFLIGLAASSYYLGELDLAYTSIEKALSVAPNNPDVLQPSSIVYASVGQFGKAYASNDALLNVSKMRQRYVRKRIADWARYYDRQDIKSDPVVSQQLAQNLDIFGVPKGGMFDPTDTSNVDPMSRGEDDDSSNTDDTEPLPPVTATPVSPVTAAPLSTQKAVPAQPLTVEAPPAAPVKPAKVVKKTITPKMALIDVAIIRTEEIYKTSKGVNLLNGLNIFFSGNQFLQFKTPMGLGRVRTPLTANDTMTLQLGTAGAGLTYSLNIFNNAYDRNE
ncbi:MAG: tetratricopeptide repeat protein, partial [Rhodospirillaceae bacterium]|nr:tetratricopeptide repeat protein [Rhodospirillaceae bacterium]